MTQIFSTIHNGTPVYELSVEDVLVARRATDSFINAAHILQIAGLSLSKRTRIIQREILPGTLTPELAWYQFIIYIYIYLHIYHPILGFHWIILSLFVRSTEYTIK